MTPDLWLSVLAMLVAAGLALAPLVLTLLGRDDDLE
jgi:hypothetical protein